jgi:hypothetical protein
MKSESDPDTPTIRDLPPNKAEDIPEELKAQLEAFARQLEQSPYALRGKELKPLVVGKRVARTLVGPSGYILLFTDRSLVVSHLSNGVLDWRYIPEMPTEGVVARRLRKLLPWIRRRKPLERILDGLGWGAHPDLRKPIPADSVVGFHPYLDEAWDPIAEVGKCEGRTVTGVSFGLDCFNFCFEEGRELTTMVIRLADGRVGWRGWWEQW